MSVLRPVTISTQQIENEGDRDDIIREFYGKIIQRLEIDPARDQPVHIEATALLLPGLSLAFGNVSSMTGKRTSEMRADGTSDIFLSFAESGMAVTDGHRGETIVKPGNAIVTSLDRPVSFFMPEQQNNLLTLQISRQALAPYMSGVDDHLTAAIDVRNAAPRALLSYTTALLDTFLSDPTNSAHLRGPASQHILELTALTLTGSRDVRDAASRGSLRAVRLAAVKAEVMRRITEPRLLAVENVAAQLDLTPRYVHMLFENEPYSFAEFVNEQKLNRAHTALTDPRQFHRRVSDIATEAGFGDIRTFNRNFARRFGMTPSDARAAAKAT